MIGRTHKLIVLFAAAALLQCATARPRKPPTRADLPLIEDRLGVAGAPTDLLDFEFEPESDDGPPKLELDGLLPPHDATLARLQPYLDSRRAYLQSVASDGSSYVVVTRLGEIAQGYEIRPPSPELVPITNAAGPIVQIARAAPSNAAWLYRSDVHGTEDYQVSRLDEDGVSLVTDGQSRHGPFAASRQGVLAFAGNARNGRDMDIYLYGTNNPSRAPELALHREGSWSVAAWSPDGKRLLLREYVSFYESAFWLASPPSERVRRVDKEIAASAVRGRFSSDTTLHITTDRGAEFRHLYVVKLPGRDFIDLTPNLTWDVDEVATQDEGRQVLFTTNEGGISRLWLRDRTATRELDVGDNVIISDLRFASDAKTASFTLDRATDTGDVWSLDIATEKLTRVTDSRSPALDYGRFVDPVLVTIPSFDGLDVPAWVYRPARGSEPAPVLLWIHGGPEAQHQPTFHPLIQFLVAELGVAVVAPNIRGSSGYGRTFVSLDDGDLREDAIRDVGAVLDWIDVQPSLDQARVAIFGGSYGGYVVLAALARFGARLAAGIDQVGVSNFVTFLENTADYRVAQRRSEYGDERDPQMRAFLHDISPTTNAHLIRSPLFVAHGANDPRVPTDEARQIVSAVRENGGEAQLLIALDEGHGFRKRANRDAFYGALVEFLAAELEIGLQTSNPD